MRIVLSSFALALAVAGAPALAVEPALNQAPGEKEQSAAQDKAAESKQICRRVVTQMGSRKRERLCMTSDQWREYNRGD